MIPNIIIYTSKNCPFSKKAKNWLFDNDLPFEEKNCSLGMNAYVLHENFSTDTTPIIGINFNKQTIVFNGWKEEYKEKIKSIMLTVM